MSLLLLTPFAPSSVSAEHRSRTPPPTSTPTTSQATPTPTPVVASFQGLGQIPGGDVQSYGLGVSEDGKVAVGYALDSANVEHAFIWTQPSGVQLIQNTL